jgi:hypothetical protein
MACAPMCRGDLTRQAPRIPTTQKQLISPIKMSGRTSCGLPFAVLLPRAVAFAFLISNHNVPSGRSIAHTWLRPREKKQQSARSFAACLNKARGSRTRFLSRWGYRDRSSSLNKISIQKQNKDISPRFARPSFRGAFTASLGFCLFSNQNAPARCSIERTTGFERTLRKEQAVGLPATDPARHNTKIKKGRALRGFPFAVLLPRALAIAFRCQIKTCQPDS